jgi:hypothetical protein
LTELEREDVRNLIRACIPSITALEVFILVSSAPERVWVLDDLNATIRGTTSETSGLISYLEAFRTYGILAGDAMAGFRYLPKSSELAITAESLIRAYHQRPVTLIRTIYSIADAESIQAFSNAFRIRKDS